MPCKAGTFNVFPLKSPPLLLQRPPCPLTFSRHGVCQDPTAPIALREPRYTPHGQETQRRVLERVNQLPTESTRSYKLFFPSDTKCCSQSPSGQWPMEQFNPSWAEVLVDTCATEGLRGPRAFPQKPGPHGLCLLTHTSRLEGNKQFPPHHLATPPTLICSNN